MKKISFLCLLFFVQISIAQTETDYTNALTAVSEAYNSNNADALFDMFTDELKVSFPLTSVKEFVTKNHERLGKFDGFDFMEDEEGSKRYLVQTDVDSFILNIGLSPEKKITKLQIDDL